ncbi:myosin light chain kinase, smooth muscle [Elysia marginata]|uniref:Myosin light chain kinase, smooth muscle n=1 Tax=Elysia marginata TaxID=1093978 RepID=A0AAV4HTX8_9GAST|nr:myosin light chain kinase, smooth muscle [Elysia marginata]
MGANQSYDGRINCEGTKGVNTPKNPENLQQQTPRDSNKHHKVAETSGKRHKAKPGPPHKPRVTEIAHDSITLSWQPPRCNPANTYGGSSAILAYTVEMCTFCAGKSKGSHGGAEGNGSGAKPKPGTWTVLTKACQAASYSAKELEPDTTYAFRVRAENLYGVGKPSIPSDPTTTRMYETTRDSLVISTSAGLPKISLSPAPYEQALSSPTHSSSSPSPPASQDNSGHRLRRRHSFNVHLDGGAVNKIANHSDVVLSSPDSPPSVNPSFKMSQSHSCHASLSPESSSSASSLLPSGFSPKHRYSDRRRGGAREDGTADRAHRLYERANNASHPSASLTSLCRKNSYGGRRGAPSSSSNSQGRKISLPILLPGTGTASLTKLRQSRTGLRSSVSDIHSNQGNTGSGLHEVMLVTVDRGSGKSHSTSTKIRRQSIGSVGSAEGSSTGKDRYSRASNGSGESEVTSSQISLEDSASSSEASRGFRADVSSNAFISGKDAKGFLGEGRCGSYNSLSLRSSRSNVTLSNSKDGSKDSLCDLTSSNHSSVGEGNADDVDNSSKNCPDYKLKDYEDDCKLNRINNNIDDSNGKQKMSTFLTQGDFERLENCDDIYKLKEQLKNFEITEENLRFHDLGQGLNCHKNHLSEETIENGSYYASLENPWEKDTSPSGLSERILAAPFCDDIKMALYARDLPDSPTLAVPANHANSTKNGKSSANRNLQSGPASYGEAGDFRTLRSVLQSSNMFVKAQRFSPDVVGVVVGDEGDTCRTLTRARLTTIADADEDEDPVRITTL